jgi:hypothetical protein
MAGLNCGNVSIVASTVFLFATACTLAKGASIKSTRPRIANRIHIS